MSDDLAEEYRKTEARFRASAPRTFICVECGFPIEGNLHHLGDHSRGYLVIRSGPYHESCLP